MLIFFQKVKNEELILLYLLIEKYCKVFSNKQISGVNITRKGKKYIVPYVGTAKTLNYPLLQSSL